MRRNCDRHLIIAQSTTLMVLPSPLLGVPRPGNFQGPPSDPETQRPGWHKEWKKNPVAGCARPLHKTKWLGL